jgi:Kdo2-lipid IVA lauroyltransferase/acyltransferase
VKLLFKFASKLPLLVLHTLGAVLGVIVFVCSGVYRSRMRENVAQANLGVSTLLGAVLHTGQMVAELPRLWLGRPVRVVWSDPQALDAVFAQAAASHKGIIFLTPHLGSWEVAGQAIASACNAHGKVMTVMYKPAKQAWLDDIVQASRRRPGLETVPADLSGVRQTLRVLKSGGAIGLLPDQVPLNGMGVWSTVFGKSAYTMTLAAKLAQSFECPVVMVWCQRLHWGAGYQVFTRRLNLSLQAPLDDVVQQINHSVEVAIQALPSEYLWSYARYKAPKVMPA